MLHKIEAIPGVNSVGLSMSVPMDGNEWSDPVFARDHLFFRRRAATSVPVRCAGLFQNPRHAADSRPRPHLE